MSPLPHPTVVLYSGVSRVRREELKCPLFREARTSISQGGKSRVRAGTFQWAGPRAEHLGPG